MSWVYLAALLVSLAGLATLDKRFQLAFWYDTRRTVTVLVAAVIVFVVWDALGIGFGIFFHGGSPYTLPLRLAPEFPLEELLFLVLLCYNTLLVWRAGEKKWDN